MDCAKGINVLTVNEGRIIDYKVGGKVIQGPLSPFVCITTTAGTASEVTSFAVITDTSTKTKFIVIDELIMADITVVDPAHYEESATVYHCLHRYGCSHPRC